MNGIAPYWSDLIAIVNRLETADVLPVQAEVEGETDRAYKFIIDREIEAPDRFQAIQSYR